MVLLHKKYERPYFTLLYPLEENGRNTDFFFFHMNECIYFYGVLFKISYKWNSFPYR